MDYLQKPHFQRIGIFASNTYGISWDHPQGLLQKHHDTITPEYPHRPFVIISGDLHCVPDDRIEALPLIGSGVLQGSTGLWYKAFPLPIFLTQDFSRTNVVHTLSRRAYSRDPPPEIMMQLCLVIQEVWDDILQARITHLSPVMTRRCRVLHRSTRLVTTIIDLAALNSLLHRAKCHNEPLLSNDGFTTSCRFNPYQKQFL